MKIATAIIPTWVVGRGDSHHHPHKKRSQHTPPTSSSSASKSSSSSSTSNDFFVLMMVLLLLLTCIISTIIMSKIIAITSSTRGNADMKYSKNARTTNFLNTFSIPRYYKSNHVMEDNKGQDPFSSFLRRKQQKQQQHRRLYEFVTPNIRDCSASGLLDTCPYVMVGSNSTGGDDNLFDGTCPSNLQQMLTDNWCYNGEKEVCCGLSSDDCCGLAKSYLALFFLLAMIALSPIFILIICAYGRCCICYPKLWNAKSNRGCGTPRPSSNDNEEKITSVQVELPEAAAVDVGVAPTEDMVVVNDEEKPVSK